MKPILAAAVLAATVLLAACERQPQPRTAPSSGPSTSPGPSATQPPQPQTGAPTLEQKKEGGNPVQGQVDPKQGAQHKDFSQPGDQAGPKSTETQPKS
jgi:hypothetical protein